MSLEEIESKLGSLIQAETISQLKSSVWKERLEGSIFIYPRNLLCSPILFCFLPYFLKTIMLYGIWNLKSVQV